MRKVEGPPPISVSVCLDADQLPLPPPELAIIDQLHDRGVNDLEQIARAVVRCVNRGLDLRSKPGIFIVRQLWALLENNTTDDADELGPWITANAPDGWDRLFIGDLSFPTEARQPSDAVTLGIDEPAIVTATEVDAFGNPELEEWQKHVEKSERFSWCGVYLKRELYFIDAAHALQALDRTRVQPCPRCLEAIRKAQP